jgi:hypothetical protein
LTVNLENKNCLIVIAGSVICAFFVFSVLNYLFVDLRITIPISIIMAVLIFGLTNYYNYPYNVTNKSVEKRPVLEQDYQYDSGTRARKREITNLSIITFVTIFIILILVCSFNYDQNFHIFTDWSDISIIGIIKLGAAIMLCFFIPGYALVLLITRKYNVNPILQILLSYLLSIFTTGLTAYIAALTFDSAISGSKNLFIAIYLSILISFLIYYPRYNITLPNNLRIKYYFCYHFIVGIITEFWNNLRSRISELLVLGSLFMLIIVSTYLLYGGTTIGDQWYHQGRALLFMSGSFREAAISGAEAFYPPFQSALLAALTTLSGAPLVNAYASIAFLNAIPMFAFYYFFSSWIPANSRKARLIACSLFTLSSGFGWIYVLNATTNHPIISSHSSLEILASIRNLDIVNTSNFVIPTAPDFSTGLIYIALPVGFVLLGMLRTSFRTRFNIFIISAISMLGIVSHYEFYLFIIIVSILPLIFKMKEKNSFYFSFIIAISIVYLIDLTTPGNFYTSLHVIGYPLLLLVGVFVAIMWILYVSSYYLRKLFPARLVNIATPRKLLYNHTRIKFATVTVIIFLSAYLYLLSFIVLGQLSTNTVMEHTSQSTVPWYVYPIKLGVAGLLGFAFILSYLFKKFEKQVFVFGIIIVIALITSPYYSESRFSKYIMIGMIGFASVMIYKILNWGHANNPVRNVAIIGVIIATSGLSILIFIGYNSLILETQDFIDTLPRRHFPSVSEMHFFEELHGMVNVDSNKYNVIGFSNQYDRWKDGFMAKIPSFAGLPYEKVRQSPLTLNASTLDALYHHLDYSDARYIVIPKNSIRAASVVTEPTRFVLEYFKPIYEDDNYILLEIPPLVPPSSSSKANVGLIYNESEELMPQELSAIRLLQFDNKSFDLNAREKSATIQNDNLTQVLSLLGAKMDKGVTIWSKDISADKKVNYIEARFRIGSENENKSDDVRIEWQEADKQYYYAKLSNNGLELYQNSKDNQYKKILLKNAEVEKKNWTWYTLKVENREDSTNVYLNNVLKIQAPRVLDNRTETICKVGLTTNYNNVEFKPLKIRTVYDYPQKIHEGIKYYNYYYPLSLLALSKSSYNIFSDTDSSVFSKRVILVSDSLKYDNVTLKKYFDYVRQGGTLIVVNSQNNFSTVFNQLFSLKSNGSKEETFTNIAGDKNQKVLINVSGLVNGINMTLLPDTQILASYRNNKNETIAPFIIEKNFSGGGKIILLNARGYFNSISDSPTQYFFTLSNISKLLPVYLGKATTSQNTSIPSKGFIGKMQINGKVTLNASSLLLPSEDNNPYPINTTRIAIFKNGTNIPIVLQNVSIKDLKIMGDYVANIDMRGSLELPDIRTNRDYIGMEIPSGFNMTIRLSPKELGNMEIVTQNGSSIRSIKVSNDSTIELYSINSASPSKSVPVVLKRPEMKVDGHISIKRTYFDGFINARGGLSTGVPLDLQGHLETRFDLVDNFEQPYRNATRSTYVTYLQSLAMDGSFKEDKEQVKLPGDIYFKAKETGQNIPLKKILNSPSNIITLIILISITVTVSTFIWRKKKV